MHHWFVTSSIQTFIAHLKKKQRIYWNVNLYIDSLKSSSWRLYFLSPPTCCEHYKCRWNWMLVPTRLWFHRLNSSSDLVSYRCIPYHFLVVVFPIIKYSKIKQSKGKVFFCETCLKERAEGWKWAFYHCQSISPSVALIIWNKRAARHFHCSHSYLDFLNCDCELLPYFNPSYKRKSSFTDSLRIRYRRSRQRQENWKLILKSPSQEIHGKELSRLHNSKCIRILCIYFF